MIVPRVPKCAICDEAIGVYEPVVVLNDLHFTKTSLAVEPLAADGADAVFHRTCVPTLRVSRFTDRRATPSHR